MLKSSKFIVTTINSILLISSLVSMISLIKNYFKPEYYDYTVNLEHIEKVKLTGDIDSLRDFQSAGIDILDRHDEFPYLIGSLLIMHLPTRTQAFINLYRSREDAAKYYIDRKKLIGRHSI